MDISVRGRAGAQTRARLNQRFSTLGRTRDSRDGKKTPVSLTQRKSAFYDLKPSITF